jgi:hypothetical protein
VTGPQAPPGKRQRPGSPTETLPNDQTSPLKSPQTLGHSSPFCRWRHFDKNRRRREHAELKRLLSHAKVASPSTFELEPAELRAEANRLVQVYGWTVAEVCAVLDVEPARCA